MTTRQSRPALTAVVVHWRDEVSLERLVAAWPEEPRFELLVVDNGRTLGSVSAPARLIVPERNLGFAGGANRGAAEASSELVLLLNPDACPEPGALAGLVEAATRHPEAAGIVPRLVGEAGETQAEWQLRPLPRPWQLLLHALFLDPVRGGEPPPGGAVEQPAAAALLLRRRIWTELGGLDASFHPAWFEDVDLARRLADHGERLLYCPTAVFRHGGGGSLDALGYGAFLEAYYRNLVRYLRKHHGRVWALAARFALVAGTTLRLAVLPLRRPRRAPGRRAAAAGLLRACRVAFRSVGSP